MTRSRRRLLLQEITTAAAVVALAAALLACQGGLSVTDAAARAARAEERAPRAERASAEVAPDDPAPGALAEAEASEEAAAAAAPALAVPVAPQVPAGSPTPAAPPVIEDMWPNKGPASGGDRVEIRGQNLRPSLILFGSVPATVLGVREERGTITLTLEAPPARAGAARVYVVVTNADGQYAVAGEKFEYYN